MKLEVGKLYCVRENPLLVYSNASQEYNPVDLIDTSQPFLILTIKRLERDLAGKFYEVIYNDRKGWIWIDTNNPAKETV